MAHLSEARRRALTGALVEDHLSLYNTSATFKTAVDQLVQLLPLWIGGIAEQAEQSDTEIRNRIEQLNRLDWPPFRLPSEDQQ